MIRYIDESGELRELRLVEPAHAIIDGVPWRIVGREWAHYDAEGRLLDKGSIEGKNVLVDVPRLIAAARKLVMNSEPGPSETLLLDYDDDGEGAIDADALHRELREALGITEEEWAKRWSPGA